MVKIDDFAMKHYGSFAVKPMYLKGLYTFSPNCGIGEGLHGLVYHLWHEPGGHLLVFAKQERESFKQTVEKKLLVHLSPICDLLCFAFSSTHPVPPSRQGGGGCIHHTPHLSYCFVLLNMHVDLAAWRKLCQARGSAVGTPRENTYQRRYLKTNMRSHPQRQAKNPGVATVCFSNASSAVNPGVHTVEHLHTADFEQTQHSRF